jgi:hypothetical protein
MPSEVVRCVCGDGRELTVLCKYETDGDVPRHGRQGTIAYEAEVYREVLRPLDARTVVCYGLTRSAAWPHPWLVVEYLDGCARADEPAAQAVALEGAAAWLGRFQARQDLAPDLDKLTRSLQRYDADHYVRSIERATATAASLPEHYAWLVTARRGYRELVDLLCGRPQIVIHGDYYADNALLWHGAVYPIDWGWAAKAVGEIDLVTLVERWPEETVQRCDQAYRQARWPAGAPADFALVRDAARLAILFRWMGHEPRWSLEPGRRWRFDAARALSERLGII